MPPQAIALKALAAVSTLFLIGFMFVLRAVTQDLYAQWGPGLSHPTVLANAMTVLPVPLIAFMARLVVASPRKGRRPSAPHISLRPHGVHDSGLLFHLHSDTARLP